MIAHFEQKTGFCAQFGASLTARLLRHLRAYIWPDQPETLTNSDDAIALVPPCPAKASASDWIAKRLQDRTEHYHLICSTVAWLRIEADGHGPGAGMQLD